MEKPNPNSLGLSKKKVVILIAFFSALYTALPLVKEHVPDWLFDLGAFVSRFVILFLGGVSV